MKLETLEKANALNHKWRTLEEAINCFEWKDRLDVIHSTNPQLIIEYDGGDDREQVKLPFQLNETLIKLLTDYIQLELEKTEVEFAEL